METDFQIRSILDMFVSQLVWKHKISWCRCEDTICGSSSAILIYVLGAVLKWLAFEKSPTHFQNKNENIIA